MEEMIVLFRKGTPEERMDEIIKEVNGVCKQKIVNAGLCLVLFDTGRKLNYPEILSVTPNSRGSIA